MRARILFAAAMMLVAGPAFAAGSTIAFSPLVQFLGPIVGALIAALVSAVLGLLIAVLRKYLTKIHINISDDQWAVVKRTAAHWAQQMWAKEDASLATASVTIAYPGIAAWATAAMNDIPAIAADLGLTQAGMAHFIVAEIGALQAKAMSVVVPPKAPATTASVVQKGSSP